MENLSRKVTLTLTPKTFVIDGETKNYVECVADINGIKIKFKPADQTGNEVVKSFVKGGEK